MGGWSGLSRKKTYDSYGHAWRRRERWQHFVAWISDREPRRRPCTRPGSSTGGWWTRGPTEQELHLPKQLACMREIFSAKEVELAEVHSELAYPQQETETAKEELTETQRELTQVRSEMKESQTRVD